MADQVKPYTREELAAVNRGTLRIAVGEYGDDVAHDGRLTDGKAHERLVAMCDRLLATAKAGLEDTARLDWLDEADSEQFDAVVTAWHNNKRIRAAIAGVRKAGAVTDEQRSNSTESK